MLIRARSFTRALQSLSAAGSPKSLPRRSPTPRLRAMISMRSDFYGSLQSDKPLFTAHLQIDVPPLGEEELREVVRRPAGIARGAVRSPSGSSISSRSAPPKNSVEDDVGVLPLLSYTLDDMWREMLKADEGVLRLPMQSFELGGVLVDRANRFLAVRPERARMR